MEERAGRRLLPDEPEFPEVVGHLWEWYQQLTATRGGGFGPAPISYREIAAWADLTGQRPTPWEVQQIKAIDMEYLVYLGDKAEREREAS